MGVGGCLRDTTGNWILGFAKYVSLGGALESELRAILTGLEIITTLPYHCNIVIETESSTTVSLLNHGKSDHHPLANLIDNYRRLLSKINNYQIVKADKKQNICANLLAKEGRKRKLPLTIFNCVPNITLQQYNNEKK